MKIGGLQKLTLIDYPGRISCTVFCLGCPFRCPWCYNPELVLPEKIKKQPQISEKEFFFFLKERENFLEGICLGGGEPTIYQDLPDFIKKIKDLGYLVKLDTNGSNPEMLENLIRDNLVNYVAMDIKAPFGAKSQISKFKSQSYEKATGVKINLEKIKKSVEIIKNSGIDYEFRTTVVPGIHIKEDILQIAREISPAKRYYLQNFRPEKTIDPDFEEINPYPQECLVEIQNAIAPFFEICQIR
ncbi:MAG: anaerobic ribonucleoside-triphosphate reductase activating protein [Candidatus Nealsonbacteria bacterium CG10_big_fil_rev_8_21_14_0_10_36_23]|uniref:Anaerobic ribonucleoside-triphosphate reductase activating protein n=1 Tax=Candidatus Nealsonbacteria bacterium CG10_big_fil_rev_8_21_14_0_10_36_23 TaxID=1974709 RepID=A0A2H0TLT0_9BACT|nr:MAG: anaerobic ribonucleoside-triphosphate reductase activating protein [Candidatus Nealsonbacteria bacterium CG10_big_fil_rev_8_21_14_0_10_36_23]